jgi:ferredoxin
MSVVTYTLAKCQKCLKCLRVCPVEAITMSDERVKINKSRCINCGKCVDVCVNQGLQAKGSTLAELEYYDVKIALVSSALLAAAPSIGHIEELFGTIRNLGFDEVIDLSPYDGAIAAEIHERISHQTDPYLISSFCPVINRLIEGKYPMLLENMIPPYRSAELAAKRIRKETEKIEKKVGIFLLCECIAKLPAAKYPYGNKDSEIDHALSIVDLFPLISKELGKFHQIVDPSADGLRLSSNPHFSFKGIESRILKADGLEKVQLALDLAEFGQLKGRYYLHLSNCINGCVGGNLLWGNPFEATQHISDHLKSAHGENAHVIFETSDEVMDEVNERKSIQERLYEYALISAQADMLPGYDCGACGFASCRRMAEEIVAGRAILGNCRILREGNNA